MKHQLNGFSISLNKPYRNPNDEITMMMIPITFQDSIKPAGLVRRGVTKFVWILFGGASVASPNGRRLDGCALTKPETAAHPAKLDSD